MRVLAVDPGEKNLGIAISDLSGTIANPLTVIRHIGRMVDAASIVQIAMDQEVSIIVVGQALDSQGEIGPQARHAVRLAEAIRQQTDLLVELWDESDSTQEARKALIALGASRRKRAGHLDDVAATVILQTYLDAKNQPFERI